MDLTEDEKERLKGYYKVAKKLEKMESAGNPNKWVHSIAKPFNNKLNLVLIPTGTKVIRRMSQSQMRTTRFPAWTRCPRTTLYRALFRHASVQNHPV